MSAITRNRWETQAVAEWFVIGCVVLAIDSAVMTGLVALIAESQINLLAVWFTGAINVFGIPFGLVGGVFGWFTLPRWVWVFIVTGWIGQVFFFVMPVETLISSVIDFAVGGVIAFGGFLAGWSIERVVDSFVAIMMMIPSGISMTGTNPFNFTAPELGAVAVGWCISILLIVSVPE